MSFTAAVRDELAHVPSGDEGARLAETATAVRLAGAIRLRGGAPGQPGVIVTTTSHAVGRRLHAALRAVTGVRPVVEVHESGGVRRTTIVLHLEGGTDVLRTLALVDDAGRPTERLAPGLLRRQVDAHAALRGALMTVASLSTPRRDPHLELRAPGEAAATDLADVLRRCGAPRSSLGPHHGGWRIAVKSGRAIGTLLARAGAHQAFLAWDHDRLHRELRGAANRAANADRANVGRAVAASSRSLEAIELVLSRVGWDGLDDDLRAVALARLANPEASLAELGALLDPPMGKAAVHRRMARIEQLAVSADA